MSWFTSQILLTVSIMFFFCLVRGQLFQDETVSSGPQPEASPIGLTLFLESSPGRGDAEDLTVQETRHKNRRQSYNRRSKPVKHQYSEASHHSDQKGSKGTGGNGGYANSNNYKTKKGYSTYDEYDRASKDKYADANHKKYGNQGGNNYGHGKGGGDGRHHSSYTKDVEDFY
jgi:hypothetical protein